jgi:hypothetical protein
LTLGIDYAWKHPDPASIKRDGYDFVLRYLSTDASKNLSATEAAALHKAGLGVGLVWETTSTRATAGYSAGHADRMTAERQAAALRYPANAVLFWAVDEQVDPSKVIGYAKGWNDGGPKRPTGPYGDKAVIEAVHNAGLSSVEWQTSAWSGGQISGQADLYQRVKTTRPTINGGGYDEDVLMHAVPLWNPPAPPAPPKPAAPAPTVPSWFKRNLTQGMKGNDVKGLQAMVGIPAAQRDGAYGPDTAKHVWAWKRAHKLYTSGRVFFRFAARVAYKDGAR